MMYVGAHSGNIPSSQNHLPGSFLTCANRGIPMGYCCFSSSASKAVPLAALIFGAALALTAKAATDSAGSPFDQLAGDWKGGGTVTPADGAPKKVACKATYKVAGGTMTQNLRCAGA